jgi:hypothetical protein
MATPPLPPPEIPPFEEDSVPPRWWGGLVGCLLFLLSAVVSIAIIVWLVKAVLNLWG